MIWVSQKKKSPVPSPLYLYTASLQSGFSRRLRRQQKRLLLVTVIQSKVLVKFVLSDIDATKFWWTQTVTNTQSVYM